MAAGGRAPLALLLLLARARLRGGAGAVEQAVEDLQRVDDLDGVYFVVELERVEVWDFVVGAEGDALVLEVGVAVSEDEGARADA